MAEEYYEGPDIDFGSDAPPPPWEFNDVIPTGYYKAVIVKKEHRQEGGRTPSFHLEFHITFPEEFACTSWDDLWLSKLEDPKNPDGTPVLDKNGKPKKSFNRGRIQVLLAAFGKQLAGKMNLNQVFNLIPVNVQCVIRTELEDDGEYGEKVRFRYYFPANHVLSRPFGPTGEKPRPNKRKTSTAPRTTTTPSASDLGDDIVLPEDEEYLAPI